MIDQQIAQRIINALEEVAKTTTADLEGAPLLDDWMITDAAAPALIGVVYGHPRLEDGHLCHTSALIAMSTTEMWARTLNRWYRLGRRAEEAHRAH